MSYSMKVVVTPLPASDDILSDRIREAATRQQPQQQQQQQQRSSTNTTTPTTTTTAASSSSINSQQTQDLSTTAATSQQQPQAICNNNNSQINTSSFSPHIAATTTTPNLQQDSSNSSSSGTTTWNAIKSVPVSQITVGPRHIALLLEDGRICRASYQVLADRLEFPPVTHHTTTINTNTTITSNTNSNSAAQLSSSMPAGGGSGNGGGGGVGNGSNSSSGGGGGGSGVAGNHQAHLQAQHSHAASSPQVNVMGKVPLSNTASGALASNPSGLSNINSPGAAGLDGRSTSSGLGSSGGSAGASGSSTGGPSSSAQSSGLSPSSFYGRVNTSPQVGGLSVQHRQAARRGRMLRQTTTRGRGAASVILGSRAVIPAQYVPEDLINQAQVVLQGKPRSAIVRELQRTNLDVNSAVNNLLSSDNEDPEDMDESQDYLPNEDLMSLLDSSVSLPTGPTSVLIDAQTVFPDDVFNAYPSRIRPTNIRHTGSGRSNSDRDGSLASELEIRRMTNRDSSQSRRWLEHALRDPPDSDNSNSRMSSATPTDFTLHHKNESNHSNCSKKSTSQSSDVSPIQISENIELWPGDKKFVQIACMHSELIAISSTGQIHQWKWSEPLPYEGIRYGDVINYHPRVAQLNLTHEKVQMLSASCIRATVVTESSKIATWVDETINIVANKLEHSAQNYPEFQRGDRVAQLHTCSLYTCVRLESGTIYWWGVAPFSQRKKNWKKIQSKASKSSSGSSSANDISVGSIVCLKNGPSFGDGAIGFTTKDGVPRVGRLTMSAWSINDTCTFKIIQSNDRKTHLSQQNPQPEAKTRARKMLGQPLDFSGNNSDEQAPTSPGMSKNCSSERLEMPPPPSPASSTCSEPGCSPSHKRKHKHLLSHKDEDRFEEQWNLKDVIFLEEVKKPPAAKVIKLDGNTALVRFNQRDPFGHQTDADVNAYLQECRMIRKDELQLARETTSSSKIIDCQRSPKKISIPDSTNFLTFAVSNNGIHALVKNGSKIEYKMYQLASGKVSKSLYFPTDTNAFLGRDPSLITLHASGESDVAVTLRDGNGSLYPLAKDFLDSLKEPQPLDMAPVQAMSMAVHPLKDPNNPSRTVPTLVIAMALESQILIPAVLRSDPEFVRLTLASLDKEPVSQQIVASEKIDLNRNILHAAVYTCAPTPSRGDKKASEDPFETYPTGISRVLNESMKRSRGKQTALAPSSSMPSTLDLSADGDRAMQNFPESKSATYEAPADWTNSIFNKFDIDPTEQKQSAHIVLLILVDCPILRPYLKDLMVQRDAHGMTPFMSAVSCRAYTAAIVLLDLAQWIINQEDTKDPEYRQRLFGMMIFPPGTNLDNNPLHMLCANDTCSFTWTGAQHINQDIFECKTCGLTRTLCCCTECARTCHKGHDCRLKKTSPTAYCDCWEKCKCKSLVAGSHFTRFKLLERLLSETDLVTYPDSKGESILLFLVQTVGRQMVEQRQYGPERSSRHSKRDDPPDMPDHDLSPPRFARKALHKMLGEWLALRTVIMAGTGPNQNLANASRLNSLLNAEDQIFLSSQQGTALLDRFTHSVLIKIGPEMLDVLLTTIIRESSSTITGRAQEARMVAKRFVRSVARNGVVLSVELSPINYSQPISMLDFPSVFNQVASGTYSGALTGANSSWKPTQQPASILQKCRKVFQALLPIAAEELAEIADALISPVRLGVPRPTAPFSLVNSMAEATQGSEEIFVVEPVVLPNPSNIEQQLPLPPNIRPAGIPGSMPDNIVISGSEPPPPVLHDNAPPSTDRIRDLLYENEMAIDAMDSEDAEASNNTFRPSNNGESDSDSDSNPDDASYQSNLDPSGPRSTTTGATAGSEVGASTAYFSEPDSGDSSNGEDDDEESDANDTEHDNDDIAFAHEDHFGSFNRRGALNPVAHSAAVNHSMQDSQAFRSTNLGQQLHWALRHRDHSFYPPRSNSSLPSTAARLAQIGLAETYSYLDGAPVRRSVMSNPSQQTNSIASNNNELSMSTTAVGLARAFSIIIRSISDLIPILKESERSDSALTINQLKVSPTEAATIICNLEKKLNPIWEWLFKVMDSTESQLRFGCALTNGIQAAAAVAVAPQQHLRMPSNVQPPPLPPVSHHQHHSRGSGVPTISNPPPDPPRPYVARTDLIQLDHAMIDRMNAQLAAAGVHRRIPHRLPEDAAQQLLIGARDDRSRAVARDRDPERELSELQAGVNLHGQIGGPSLNSAVGAGSNRPQALSSRANLSGSNYVTRMSLNDPAPVERLDGTAARRDFLSYMISLIRGHGNEHHDSLPILDVSSLRHIAYVFDAYIYYLQALSRNKTTKPNNEWTDDEDLSPNDNQGANHRFFRRSESTLFLDSNVPDPFSVPLSEALPLAEQPHLLQPNSRREDLFGAQRATVQDVNIESLPMQLGLSRTSRISCPQCLAKQQLAQNLLLHPNLITSELYAQSMARGNEANLCPIHKRNRPSESSSEVQHTALLARWRLTVELFGREFLDDVGAEPGSILTDLVGFPIKEIRFRKEMERLRNDSAPREISLTNVDRDKNLLIRQTIKELNSAYHMAERPQCRRNLELPLLACSKVKVSFKDEKGEGNGVARSFYTAFCEAVLSNEKLANLEAPLFYQPGLRNFYSPRQGDPSPDRLNAYRNVGRVIGICLSQSEICPIQLSRHAIKYILRKPISWHDLAFFDPVLYESLRQLIMDAKTNVDAVSSLQALDLRFCVDLSVEEGGGQVELTPGGRNIEVTQSNIYEYVRRYAMKRMLKSQEKALSSIRQGVMDVLPPTALDNLSAEDFRLLLNGVGEINVQTLISYTSFIDDRGTSAGKRTSVQVEEQLGYFKKWFWSIVEKMTTKERQDLVYFWTGSPSLPASEEGFQPMPTVSIRPAEDLHLPTSNVCIFRLYIPLYSSKAILKSKLLIAIKEKNFGFI